jgi:hypothetical protein
MRVVSLIAMLAFVASACWAIDPPKGLSWGMTYDQVKTKLESAADKKDQSKLKESKTGKDLADGFTRAEIEKIEVLKKKPEKAYAIFQNDSGLCAVYYVFRWKNDEKEETMFDSKGKGRSKCWGFHQDLVNALASKYGDPTSDETLGKRGEVVGNGVRFNTTWTDDSGSELIAYVTRSTKNMGPLGRLDDYYVILLYQIPLGAKAEKANTEAAEDL